MSEKSVDSQIKCVIEKLKRWRASLWKEMCDIYPPPDRGTYQLVKINKNGVDLYYLVNVWSEGSQVRSKSLGRLEFHMPKERFDEYHKLQRTLIAIEDSLKWLERSYKALVGVKVSLRNWREPTTNRRGRPRKYITKNSNF